MGEIDFEFHLEDRGSETLLVSLHGAVNRSQANGPLFAWRNTLASRRESFLCIADPMLALNDRLTLGWYAGTSRLNLHEHTAEFAADKARSLGAKRIVFLGSSGGGFAAMAISAYAPGSVAVAFSPTTAVDRVTPAHTSNLLEAAFPEFGSFDQVKSAFPGRVSLDYLYSSDRPNSFIHVQNSGDRTRLEGSYRPFAERHGVVAAGQSHGGRRRFALEHHGDGHVSPPTASIHYWLDQAISSPSTQPGI